MGARGHTVTHALQFGVQHCGMSSKITVGIKLEQRTTLKGTKGGINLAAPPNTNWGAPH